MTYRKRDILVLPTLLLLVCSGKAQPETSLQPYLAAIFAHNADTLQKWYTRYLGFKIKDHKKNIVEPNSNFYLLEKDSFLLEIVERPIILDTRNIKDTMRTFKYLSGYFKTGFYVKDIRNWYNYLRSEGVMIQSENVSKGETGLYILCVDPEGNLVQLFDKGD